MQAPTILGRRRTFLLGSLLVVAGVLLHLPMFGSAADMHYRMRGMAIDLPMAIGMMLLVGGMALGFAGVLRPRSDPHGAAQVHRVAAVDESTLLPAHRVLIAGLIFAIAVDTQKPFTFTFILPAVAAEYGLSSLAQLVPGAEPVAWLPFAGILGTAIGSFAWGYLGDRIGRRSSILVAALLFVATSVCGVMPSFGGNILMCFLMGLGAGGMLPAAYTLLAEMIPAGRRGQVMVLVSGLGTALGFLISSWTATLLMPVFGWRILWLAGLPTGLVLLAVSRYIPESPRYLLLHGRVAEAQRVLTRFGMVLVPETAAAPPASLGSFSSVLRGSLGRITGALVFCGLAWGLVNFGFLVWLPTTVGALGQATQDVTELLAGAALFAVLGAVLVAHLYGRWSTRRTTIAATTLTGGTLVVFWTSGTELARSSTLLPLVVVLLVGSWAVNAVLAPYSTEVYPTAVRARGAALTAGAGKLGGVLALGMAVTGVAPPGLASSAALAAVPMLLGAGLLHLVAVETRARPLEEIAAGGPTQVVR